MIRRNTRRERGAAAVEFALLLPVLLLIIGATVDFGRLYYAQNIVGNAAREGARMRALTYTPAQADTRISQAMINYQGTSYITTYTLRQASGDTGDGVCPATPAPTDRQRVTIRVTGFTYIVLGMAATLTGGALNPPSPNGSAEMRCGG